MRALRRGAAALAKRAADFAEQDATILAVSGDAPGELVNHGTNGTADHGQIALQAEGAMCEFRRVELTPLGR